MRIYPGTGLIGNPSRESEKDFFMKKQIIILAILVVALLAINQIMPVPQKSDTALTNKVLPAQTKKIEKLSSFSYQGKDGVDALSLLKQKAKIEENQPGFVSAINGRRADPQKKEFWAFYVNNKLAEVGAADYVTENTDKIEWKIQNY